MAQTTPSRVDLPSRAKRRDAETSVLGSLLRGPSSASTKKAGAPRFLPNRTTSEDDTLSPEQDKAYLASVTHNTRRATLGSISNTSNEDTPSRRASTSSWTSSLDLLSALQTAPATLAADHSGRVDLLHALRSSPSDENEPVRYTGRRHSAISLASSTGTHNGIDILQVLRDGPFTRSALTMTRKPNGSSPRSSISSSTPATTTASTFSVATTTAPLLPSPSPHRNTYANNGSPTPSFLSILSRPGSLADERRSSQAAPAFAALRRRAHLSRSDLATQLLTELAFAAAEHACSPTSSTAEELEEVAREVADSHAVGPALTAALARGGYGPLALCTPAEAARLWRDLGGPETFDDGDQEVRAGGAPGMERLGSADSSRSEELLDEGRRRWTEWQRSQGEA